jgi:dTDP-4-dehydrorhamnose reductase
MTLLIAGRSGQLARALIAAAKTRGLPAFALGRSEMDMADPASVRAAVARLRPAIVINTAAFTAVDDAESRKAGAFAINAAGAGARAAAAHGAGARLVHVSTDYVFGAGAGPRLEGDPAGPLNVYGASKLEGERRAAAAHPRALIVRTSGVFSAAGQNFLTAMLRLAETREEIGVVDDQRTTPTPADALAGLLLDLARDPRPYGLLHAAGTEAVSWAGFARAIFEGARERGLPHAEVRPIPSSQFPRPARRPNDSALGSVRLHGLAGVDGLDWRAGLARALDALAAAR